MVKTKEKINKEFLIGLLVGIILGIIITYCVFYFTFMETIEGTIRTFQSMEGIITNANLSLNIDLNESQIVDRAISVWGMKVA